MDHWRVARSTAIVVHPTPSSSLRWIRSVLASCSTRRRWRGFCSSWRPRIGLPVEASPATKEVHLRPPRLGRGNLPRAEGDVGTNTTIPIGDRLHLSHIAGTDTGPCAPVWSRSRRCVGDTTRRQSDGIDCVQSSSSLERIRPLRMATVSPTVHCRSASGCSTAPSPAPRAPTNSAS